ncbi:hypothetical protein [Methanobrevibacter arboriphilus]|uniref:hypothetical protein n=1 Tax=Methanobrevibacter arboriphilus TaxID=39441 RepID=UPI000AA40022|nr:hypothetical protein [Methanobrevibacter arboriphilus]
MFFITVLYGFIYANSSLGLNLITIGSAGIILQAAFPIFINYFFNCSSFRCIIIYIRVFQEIY